MFARSALLYTFLLCFTAILATIPTEEDDSDETFQPVTVRRRNHNGDGFRHYVGSSGERPISQSHLERQWNTAQARGMWNEFKETFEKVYESVEEELERFKIFFVNHQKIVKHNKEYNRGRHTYTLKMNEFGDMSHVEFVSTMNGFKRRYGDSMVKRHATTFLPPHNVLIPDAVDWRQQGYVTAVKNQGQCGSCWSFSASGALEGQHFRKTGVLVSLSEQNLVDCSTKYGNQGCNGGLMDQAFQYVKDNNGIDTEQSYPYEAKDDRCRFKRTNVGASDSGFVDVQQGNETALKIALATVGPVSVAIDASHESFQFYSQGIYNEQDCSPDQLDHGVLAVGYGTLGEGQDFWIVKNSWGPTWGQKGYIMMTRNQENQCGIASSASYPLV